MSFASSLRCGRCCSWGKHSNLTVVDLGPAQLAMNPAVGVECQATCQSFDLNVGCTTVQGSGDAIGIEAKGEQAVAARTSAVWICVLQRVAHGVGKITA